MADVKVDDVKVDGGKVVDGGDGTPKKSEPQPVPYSKFRDEYKSRKKWEDKYASLEADFNMYKEEAKEKDNMIAELSTYKEKIVKWEEDRLNEKIAKWNDKAKIFDIDESKKDYEKIKKIKEKFKFQTDEYKLTNDDLIKNEELFEIYNDAGYFESLNAIEDKTNKAKTQTIPKNQQGEYYGYKTKYELAINDPKKWEQWKQENVGG